jgi:SAM-dependent methyltransferase
MFPSRVENQTTHMSARNYTFGDTDEASARLRLLAELYEPETRRLLERGAVQPRLAIDLGCGPGWSTRLLHDVLKPVRTVGYDASERFIVEARRNHSPALEFHVQDVVLAASYIPQPEVFLCRFLLTHLSSIGEALAAWANAAKPSALLFIHETESLQTENPVLDRYYELVALLQAHYGQTLYVSGLLEAFVEQSGWKIIESERPILEKAAQKMAGLHLPNLRTWRNDEYAKKSLDAIEIEALETSLSRIVSGEENAGVVVNAARQIIARRK